MIEMSKINVGLKLLFDSFMICEFLAVIRSNGKHIFFVRVSQIESGISHQISLFV
jgi:hypothetical protein